MLAVRSSCWWYDAGDGQPSAQMRPLLRAIQQAGRRPSSPSGCPTRRGARRRQLPHIARAAWTQTQGAFRADPRFGPGPALAAVGIDLAAARLTTGQAQARVVDLPITVMTRTRAAESVDAPNVAALLPGGDPALAAEVVVLSAHMDHVGVTGVGRCRAVGADSICNGADDNASGPVSVLELAEAFAALSPQPRRSILFVTVSGEARPLGQ
jgi:hypothetical protein